MPDIRISDYSGIVLDDSIIDRLIFCYGNDYDPCAAERGLYTDLDGLFSKGMLRAKGALLKACKEIDYEAKCAHTRTHFKEAYIAPYGNAAEKAVQIIFRGVSKCLLN